MAKSFQRCVPIVENLSGGDPLYDFINAELRDLIRLQGTQVMFYLPWENWFSAIHHEEGADVCGVF